MKVKGHGSIRPVKNKKGKKVKNSWQLVVSLGNDPLTGKRVQKCRHFKGTKTEAWRALDEFVSEIERGLKLDADKATFGEYARQWHEGRKASGRYAPSTMQRDGVILSYLLRHLETVPLGSIDATTVRNLYATLADEGTGQPTMVKASVLLKQILRQAVNDDIILRNPCDCVEAPKQPKPKRGTALDRKGVSRLVQALKDEESKEYPLAQLPQQKHTTDMAHVTVARLALGAGLRRGEILGLSWSDVNIEAGELHVCHTLCKATGKLKEPKTANSNRYVSIDAQLMSDLLRWKATQARYLLSLGIAQSASTPVITNEAGNHMNGDNLNRWWRSFTKAHGFEGLRIHDLRHTHATMLVSSGLNIKAVSSRIGHASVGITLDLYSHAQREDDEKAAAIMGEIMAEPAPIFGRVVNL